MPQMSSATGDSKAEVRVGISLAPPRQSRWSVLLRAFSILPLYLVVVVVGLAVIVVTVVAWFCALFTGRVTDSQQRFLTNALRLYANVLSYGYLLSSRWPGITFNAKSDDQVSIDIDHVRLRRSSVFFRFVLIVPAWLVGAALSIGSYPLLLVAWVWGILTGREPRSIHQALALILRYQIRLQAYLTLLAPTQPFVGFLGDGDEPSLKTFPNVDPALSSIATQTFPPTDDSTASQGSSTVMATPTSLSTRWIVTKGTKVLMVLVVIAGVLLYFVTPAIEDPFLVRIQDIVARGVVTSSHTATLNAMRSFETSTGACQGTYALECQQRAATLALPRLSDQSALLLSNNIFVPTSALAAVKKYESAIVLLESDLNMVQSSTSLSSQTQLERVDVPEDMVQVDRDYHVAETRLGA